MRTKTIVLAAVALLGITAGGVRALRLFS